MERRCAVLYHCPCPDGAFAALAAHLYFKAINLPVSFCPNAVYKPIRLDELPLGELDNIYLLDFSGPPGFIAELSTRVKRIIVLDHHKTALEMLSESSMQLNNVIKVLDMQRSGATISFCYFRELLKQESCTVTSSCDAHKVDIVPETDFERISCLFQYIEDGDLWRWVLPESKAFSSGLKDININYNIEENPALFDKLLSLDPVRLIGQGRLSLSQKQKLINDVLDCAFEINLGCGSFGRCLAVDADSIPELRSELGNQLAEKSQKLNLRGIGAVVYRIPQLQHEQLLKVSLRSVGMEDTTPISEEYGGGGHRNASSFMLTSSEFDMWKVAGKSQY